MIKIIIAHRAILGPDSEHMQNDPSQISEAIWAGFYAEVDLWCIDDELFLGHDEPTYPITYEWFQEESKRLFVFWHCKNLAALETCIDFHQPHFFAHDKDDFVLTSSKYVWTYPNSKIPLGVKSIPVIYDTHDLRWNLDDIMVVAGVCTDEPFEMQKLLRKN